MNRLSLRQILVFLLIFTAGISVCDAQTKGRSGGRDQGKGISGLFSGKRSGSKIKAPEKASKVIKEQAKKKKKADEDYVKSVKNSQKRTIKIQTPDVQDRMKKNQTDIKVREKTKKKNTSSATRKAGRKYKK